MKIFEAIIKTPFFVLLWILFLTIKIPTVIIGLFVVPFLWIWREVNYTKLPAWTRPWANQGDWFGGPYSFENSLPYWWVSSKGKNFKSFYTYHALRNPANGLRSFEFLDLDIDRQRVKYLTPKFFTDYEPAPMRNIKTNMSAYICWQGLKSGVKVIFIWSYNRHFVLKIGWRVHPIDAHEDIAPGIRQTDAGFATKLLPYRKG